MTNEESSFRVSLPASARTSRQARWWSWWGWSWWILIVIKKGNCTTKPVCEAGVPMFGGIPVFFGRLPWAFLTKRQGAANHLILHPEDMLRMCNLLLGTLFNTLMTFRSCKYLVYLHSHLRHFIKCCRGHLMQFEVKKTRSNLDSPDLLYFQLPTCTLSLSSQMPLWSR